MNPVDSIRLASETLRQVREREGTSALERKMRRINEQQITAFIQRGGEHPGWVEDQ